MLQAKRSLVIKQRPCRLEQSTKTPLKKYVLKRAGIKTKSMRKEIIREKGYYYN